MRIVWDADKDRFFSAGVSQGVLYPQDVMGVAWNGLISVSENGEQDQEAHYFNGIRYHSQSLSSAFSGTISAYTYPDEFGPYTGIDGIFTNQSRLSFGLTYRTNREIHIVYNALTSPSKRAYSSTGSKMDPVVFEWDFTTLPVKIPGGKPSSHIVILTMECPPGAITDLETVLYGDDLTDPSLPLVEDIIEIFESNSTLRVTDNGDGTFTISGPDTAVYMTDADSFQINWSSLVMLDSTHYRISSE
jgi:hypothetical protein